MKSFITSVIIALIIVFGSLFYTQRIDNVSESLCLKNREIIALLEDENFIDAEKKVDILAEFVDEKKITLAIIMDHSELDKIEMGIAELKAYVSEKAKADAISRCNTLDVMMRHMPKNYKLKIENVL